MIADAAADLWGQRGTTISSDSIRSPCADGQHHGRPVLEHHHAGVRSAVEELSGRQAAKGDPVSARRRLSSWGERKWGETGSGLGGQHRSRRWGEGDAFVCAACGGGAPECEAGVEPRRGRLRHMPPWERATFPSRAPPSLYGLGQQKDPTAVHRRRRSDHRWMRLIR